MNAKHDYYKKWVNQHFLNWIRLIKILFNIIIWFCCEEKEWLTGGLEAEKTSTTCLNKTGQKYLFTNWSAWYSCTRSSLILLQLSMDCTKNITLMISIAIISSEWQFNAWHVPYGNDSFSRLDSCLSVCGKKNIVKERNHSYSDMAYNTTFLPSVLEYYSKWVNADCVPWWWTWSWGILKLSGKKTKNKM